MDLILKVAALIVTVIVLFFPFYLISFLLRKVKIRNIAPGKGPSFLTLFLYIIIVSLVVVSIVDNSMKADTRARSVEAINNLESILSAQKAYFKEHKTYAGTNSEEDAFELMKWSPPKSLTKRAYYCGGTVINNGSELFKPPEPGPDWPYPIKPYSSKDGFICMTISNIDDDPFFDIYAIDHLGKILRYHDDIKDNIKVEMNRIKNPVNVLPDEDFQLSGPLVLIITVSALSVLLIVLIIRDRKSYKAVMAGAEQA